jgi:hypothetical protein
VAGQHRERDTSIPRSIKRGRRVGAPRWRDPRRGLVRRSCPARFRFASDDNWIVKIGSLNLQHCQFERHRRAKGEPKGNGHAAAVAVSHLLIASARELRRVRRDTRYSFIGGNWGVFAIEVYWTGNPGSRGSASLLWGLSSVDWRFQRLSHRFYALGLPDTRSISNRL